MRKTLLKPKDIDANVEWLLPSKGFTPDLQGDEERLILSPFAKRALSLNPKLQTPQKHWTASGRSTLGRDPSQYPTEDMPALSLHRTRKRRFEQLEDDEDGNDLAGDSHQNPRTPRVRTDRRTDHQQEPLQPSDLSSQSELTDLDDDHLSPSGPEDDGDAGTGSEGQSGEAAA